MLSESVNFDSLSARVHRYPRGGEARVVEGDYLNNWGVPTPACGLGELAEHLELELVDDDRESTTRRGASW